MWPDGHERIFGEDWLMYRRFSNDLSDARKLFYKRKPKLWGREMENNIARVKYIDVMRFHFLK